MIESALPGIEDYVAYLHGAEIPVLRITQRHLDESHRNIDRITRDDLSTVLLRDPLMTLKVLSYIQPMHGKSLRGDISTIGAAVMMLGIEPFFRRFAEVPLIEDRLAGHREVLLGILQTIRRAQRAATFAYDWALWRHDLNAEEVRIAALLYDLAELLIWTFAPKLAMEIQKLQAANPNLRSVVAQKAVLGITLHDLQLAMVQTWQLPQLLRQIMDDANAEHPRVRNVALAVNLARHTSQNQGWGNPAVPDDLKAIGTLLNLNEAAVRQRIGMPDPEDTADATNIA